MATPDYKTVCNKCNKEVAVDSDGGEKGHGAPCVEPKESAASVAPKHQDAPRK
jgi:hypothetical protein